MTPSEQIRHRKLRAGAPKPKKTSKNPWIVALKHTREQHPTMNLKQAMVWTKEHYTRKS
jgi:hypothetical protein